MVSTSGSASRFFGVRSGSAGSRSSRSSSTRKRKKHFNAAVVRAWLDTAGRLLLLAREEGAQVRHLHLPELADPLTLQVRQTRQNVTLVRRASHRGKPSLEPAKAQEIGHFRTRQFSIDPPLGSLPAPAGASARRLRLTGLLRKKPRQRGFFYCSRSVDAFGCHGFRLGRWTRCGCAEWRLLSPLGAERGVHFIDRKDNRCEQRPWILSSARSATSLRTASPPTRPCRSRACLSGQNLRALGEIGALGLLVPAEHGGAGGALSVPAEACEAIGSACASTGMVFLMHEVTAATIAAGGGDARGELLDRIASGAALGTLAFSERGTGAHFYSPELKAVRTNGVVTFPAGRASSPPAGTPTSTWSSSRVKQRARRMPTSSPATTPA